MQRVGFVDALLAGRPWAAPPGRWASTLPACLAPGQIKYVGRQSKRKFWAVVDMIHRFPQVGGEPFPMSKLTNPPADADADAAAAAVAVPHGKEQLQ